MFKRLIFLSVIILAGCSNPPAPKPKSAMNNSHVKRKTSTVKPSDNPWTINSFAPKEGEKEGKKFVRFATEGTFSDSTSTDSYLFAEVLINKASAGFFLHEFKKSNPAVKFSDHIRIKMTNSSGEELQMTSTRAWNKSGGILIEKNNNDYSQFRIFLLQSTGNIGVEIRDQGSTIYHFNINTDGFSDSFTSL